MAMSVVDGIESKELAVSVLYPSAAVVGGGGVKGVEEGSNNKCICVIGNRAYGDFSLQLFTSEASVWRKEDLEAASCGVAKDTEYQCVDANGNLVSHKPFKQVDFGVRSTSLVFFMDGNRPTFYCLGGYFNEGCDMVISRDVRNFGFDEEEQHHHKEKEKVPCMTTPRVSPAVVALDGKIYVFGGVHPRDQEQQLPWAECLDVAAAASAQEEKVWTPLASPPCDLWFRGLFALVVDDGENIFFGTSSSEEDMKEKEGGGGGGRKAILVGSTLKRICIAYHIREDRWITLPSCIPFYYHGFLPVVDGDILYWVGCGFFAYDLRRGTVLLCGAPIRGLGNYLCHLLWNVEEWYTEPSLHHLGGEDFCLTWFDWVSFSTCTFTRLHSTVIRVVLPPKDGSHRMGDAFVVTSRSYLLPHGFTFQQSLLLDGFFCDQEVVKGVTSEIVGLLDESLGGVKYAIEASEYEGVAKGMVDENDGIGLHGVLLSK